MSSSRFHGRKQKNASSSTSKVRGGEDWHSYERTGKVRLEKRTDGRAGAGDRANRGRGGARGEGRGGRRGGETRGTLPAASNRKGKTGERVPCTNWFSGISLHVVGKNDDHDNGDDDNDDDDDDEDGGDDDGGGGGGGIDDAGNPARRRKKNTLLESVISRRERTMQRNWHSPAKIAIVHAHDGETITMRARMGSSPQQVLRDVLDPAA